MAEGFDPAKASSDLKYMLKMSQISQGGTANLKKKKKTKRTEDTNTFERNYGGQHSQHSKYSDRSSYTHTNSNGNALLDLPEADSVQQSNRGSAGYNGGQSVSRRKNRDKDISRPKYSESKSTSSAPLQKGYSENLESLEVVNSNRRIPSGVKDRNNSKQPEFVKSPLESAHIIRRENSYQNRNASAFKNYRRNERFMHGEERADGAEKGNNRDSYRNEGRGDRSNLRRNEGRNQREMSDEMRSSSANSSKPHSVELEEEVTEEFLLLLQENKIEVLKKRNLRFHKARYVCNLCDFHLDSKIDCEKHMKDYRHYRRKKLYDEDEILKSIPEPSELQFAALTSAVEKLYAEHGINDKQKKQRTDIVLRLDRILKEKIPDVLVFMYGSSLTGFGLKTADINVDLASADKNKKLTSLLKEAFLSLKDITDSGFINLRSDFTAKVPSFLLTDDLTGLTARVMIHCYSAHCSSELFSIYSDFDVRVRKLAVAFRYWAHLCDLDRQCDGFLPPQALNLMVIYFLQNIDPQLVPIIKPPKVTGDETGDYRKDSPAFEKMRAKVMKDSKRCRNNMSVGELWFRLLHFYSLEFDTPNVVVCIRSNQLVPRNSKPWNSKKLAVEDPYVLKRNITGMFNNSRVYDYWEDSIRKALHYFGLPRDTQGNSQIPLEVLMEIKRSQQCQQTKMKESTDKVAQNANINDGDDKRKLASKNETTQETASANKGSQLQKLKDDQHPQSHTLGGDIKDSSHSESDDVNDSDNDNSDFVDVTEQQLTIASYGAPQSQSPTSLLAGSAPGIKPGALSQQERLSVLAALIDIKSMKLDNSDSGISVGLSPASINSYVSQRTDESDTASGADLNDRSIESHFKKEKPDSLMCKNHENKYTKSGKSAKSYEVSLGISDRCSPSSVSDSGHKNKSGINSEVTDVSRMSLSDAAADDHRSSQSSLYLSSEEGVTEENKAASLFTLGECHYEFSKELLTDGKGPVLVCTYCEKEGHLKNTCPDDKLPEVLPLPLLTIGHIKALCETLNKLPSKIGLSLYQLAERVNFMKDLEEFIRVQFKDANLALFGSSCNGFGFDRSDMDICLTFSERKVIDKPWLIESLARKMKQNKDLVNVQAISTAKVPIVKFTVRSMDLEADISLYNILAQHNTKLLLCYSQIDPRVKILGYAIKNFAKVCDIGDASRGSLSSYAYILMMIYYLQQVTPPVIPVLQELYESKEKPHLMVEECNTWFMDDISRLGYLWPQMGKNKMYVAELWLGFLRFYVEEFNCNEFVVSIRQKEPLTRFEKLWNGESIAIEDPFEVSHNLGSGLSRKMNNFIFKTFINGRMLYGSPIDDNMAMFKTYSNAYDYFFDRDLLSECRPPNVRGCRHCGKIGHLARSCPAARKDKDKLKDIDRQQQQLSGQQRQSPSAQQQKQLQSSQQDRQQQQKQLQSSQQDRQQQKQLSSLQQDRQQQQKQLSSSQQDRQQQQPPSSQQDRQQQLRQPSSSQQNKQQRQLLSTQQDKQQQKQPLSSHDDKQQRQPPSSQPGKQQQQKQLASSQQDQQQKQPPSSQQDQQQKQPPSSQQDQQQKQPPSSHQDQQQKQPPSSHQDKQRQPPSSQQDIQQQQQQPKQLQQQPSQLSYALEQQNQPSQEILQEKHTSQQQEDQSSQSHPQQQRQLLQPKQQQKSQPSHSSHQQQENVISQIQPQQQQRPPLIKQLLEQPFQQPQQKQPLPEQEQRQPTHQQQQRQPSQQYEQRHPTQHQQLKQPPLQHVQRQPSQQHEQRQPAQQQEQRQPSHQQEQRQPAQHEQRQPAQQQEQRQPAQHEQRQPAQQQEQRQPSHQQEQRQPAQHEQRQPAQQQEQRQPSQQQEQRQPAQHEQRQPAQQQEQRQPSQQQEQRQPAQHEQKQPSQHQQTQPSQHQQRQSSQQQEQRQPSQQQEQKQPSQHEQKQPSQHQQTQPSQHEQRQPSQHEQRQPSQQHEQRQLSQHEQRQPLQQHEQRQSSQHQQRQPSQQYEQRQLLQHHEQSQPPQHQQHKQPLIQYEQRQPSQYQQRQHPHQQEKQFQSQHEQRQPSRQQDQRQPSQHQEHRHPHYKHPQEQDERQPPEHIQQQQWPTSHPHQQHIQSPQPQHEIRQSFQPHQTIQQQQHARQSPPLLSQSPQPEQHFSQSPQPEQHFSQSPQPHQMQSFQQLQGQPFHPVQQSQHQQWQRQKLQQPIERDIHDRQEQEHHQRYPVGNTNINSSVSSGPGLPYNFTDHQNTSAAIPAMEAGMHSQVFHNSSYMHHQQRPHGSYRPNSPVMPPPGFMPQGIPRMNLFAFGHGPPPGFNHNMRFPPAHPHAPHNFGSDYSHGYHVNRSPQTSPAAQYSGPGVGYNNTSSQFMSPAVQNMFNSTGGQVLNAGSELYFSKR